MALDNFACADHTFTTIAVINYEYRKSLKDKIHFAQ